MTNEYRLPSHGVGTINLFPTLSIDNVLYVFGSPFNLLSSRLTYYPQNCMASHGILHQTSCAYTP